MGRRKTRNKATKASKKPLLVGMQQVDDEDAYSVFFEEEFANISRSTKTKKGKQMHTGYQGQGAFGGGGTGYYKGAYCSHRGSKRVGEPIDGRELFAAGTMIEITEDTRLVIDLAGSADSDFKPDNFVMASSTDDMKDDLMVKTKRPISRLRLNWPDMQAPHRGIGVDFWRAVWAKIPNNPKDTLGNKTIVCCMGGHGRTGTCLAALLICNAGFSMPNAVNYVRLHHCTKAVESQTQIDYLRWLALTAGTNTQPFDEAQATALAATEASTETGTKSYSSQPTTTASPLVSNPGAKSPSKALPAPPLQVTALTEDMIKAAAFVLVQLPAVKGGDKPQLAWLSREAYANGAFCTPGTATAREARLPILALRYA
jgi:hypothetical protein